MCGIVAYIGGQNATPIVLGGLKKLEYRGYDSAGIAVLQNGKIEIRRDAGKIDHLETLITQEPLEGNLGIGHTRWATHGAPNMQNAHPHISSNGEIVIVHNGIVENYLSLREELRLANDARVSTLCCHHALHQLGCSPAFNSLLQTGARRCSVLGGLPNDQHFFAQGQGAFDEIRGAAAC